MRESVNFVLNDPHAFHAAVVHWPIVLAPVGFACLLWYAGSRRKTRGAGVAAVVALLLASVGAGVAAGAGEEAIAAVRDGTPAIADAGITALKQHESLGEGAWMWPLVCAILGSLALVPRPKWLQRAALVLAIIATFSVTLRFAWTAHTGGVIVYVHGLGIPDR